MRIKMLWKKTGYLLIFIVFTVNVAIGQTASSVSGELNRLYGRLLKITDDSSRIQINDSIKNIIDSYVESDSVFNHRFTNVRYLGQITSPDSLLKIVTWNLVLRDKPCRYYCYFIMKQQQAKPARIYNLTAEYSAGQIKTDTTYSSDKWYGALYYDIRPQVIKGMNCWILLGIDYGNPDITRKIIEIITFDKDESIVFGLDSFLSSDTIRYREVFEYSSTATMSLRFDGDDSIIFDHLVPFSPELVNDRQYYGPQYSNDAYVLENGLWRFRLNVDVRNKEILNK
jgi:hypothetical protein